MHNSNIKTNKKVGIRDSVQKRVASITLFHVILLNILQY